MNNYDVIVLGTGGVGSATAFHLVQRGASVLGLDRFSGAHPHGSSHGQTRMIRKAYFEQADYVPLLNRTYALWQQLEELRSECQNAIDRKNAEMDELGAPRYANESAFDPRQT